MRPFAVESGRVSFSWFRRTASRLDEPPWGAEWDWAGRSVPWRQRFQQATEGARPGGLDVPWPPAPNAKDRSEGHRFWASYARGGVGADIPPRSAWEHFVPFRVELPFSLSQADGTRIDVEGRVFPYGVGVIVNAEVDGPLALDAFRRRALALRREEVHVRLTGMATGGAAQRVDAWAAQALQGLASRLVGDHAEPTDPPTGPDSPFSVVTVVRAAGAAPRAPDRTLQTLCTWHEGLPLLDAATTELPLGDRPSGDRLRTSRRGRVVWYPSAFEPTSRERHLGDLHRALTWLGLQVDGLGSFLLFFADEDDERRRLSPVHIATRRHAALLAGRLVGQSGVTPASASQSAARQIIDNYKDAADVVRAQVGHPPLKLGAWPIG